MRLSSLKLTLMTLILCGLLLWLNAAYAGERAEADISCAPAGRDFAYDCEIALTGRKSGEPMEGAELVLGADMPSMPMAHNVRPVSAEPGAGRGEYHARIELEMYGEWVLRLDVSGPTRDKIIVKKHFGKSEVSDIK